MIGRMPDEVRGLVGRYQSAIDAALGDGRVQGLYLVGSVALDAYQAGQSDIDVLAVTASSLTEAEIDVAERVHAAISGKPHFDVAYLTWEDLATSVFSGVARPFVLGNVFKRNEMTCCPVTWLELQRYGIPVRGPAPEQLNIWVDPDELILWNRKNLLDYWQPWQKVLEGVDDAAVGDQADWAMQWCVLGAPRLHFTIRTGEVTSKIGAGQYSLKTFDSRFHDVIREALRIRREEPEPRLGPGRFTAAAAFLDHVIQAALT